MPWPFKNSDGVIKKEDIKDPWGIPLNDWNAQPLGKGDVTFPLSKNSLYKDMYGGSSSYQDKVEQIKHLLYSGLITYGKADELAKHLGVAVPMDDNPILIKATQPHNIIWHVDDHPILKAEPIKMKAIRQDIRTDIGGTAKNISHNMVLDQSRDYTESELRSMLMQGFSKMTDIIINELKKEKK